ncbi:hypothetical protein B4064_0865 [Caldibacillus thermoamylovorans]|uniref:Uncharacterized protein n=1 Tax=Caldibacillus thermoamylovorans TaxID=35841 RepID=A0A0D0FDH6_9BACI|nr:hypothetical protein B4065_0910 [Caldibacillus thermoamylovorans]KIO61925.1 hypothetical protein B4064_0865 [Caldibacillus thermoamylovorans]KIO70808.1 hypothetical protein B4166_1433 [Caldibacillus thermoamylovorans]KIO74271.1 hypothetical protein B4167_1556 [Caldibacillus thermoamylovorans]
MTVKFKKFSGIFSDFVKRIGMIFFDYYERRNFVIAACP